MLTRPTITGDPPVECGRKISFDFAQDDSHGGSAGDIGTGHKSLDSLLSNAEDDGAGVVGWGRRMHAYPWRCSE